MSVIIQEPTSSSSPLPLVIVRDFAFDPLDARFHGQVPLVTTGTVLGDADTAVAVAAVTKGSDFSRKGDVTGTVCPTTVAGSDLNAASDVTSADRQGDTNDMCQDGPDSDSEEWMRREGWEWKWSYTSSRTSTTAATATTTTASSASSSAETATSSPKSHRMSGTRSSAMSTTARPRSLPVTSTSILKSSDLEDIVLPLIASAITKRLGRTSIMGGNSNSGVSSDTAMLTTRRLRAVFPFVKAAKYEMSIDAGDEVIVLDWPQREADGDFFSDAPTPMVSDDGVVSEQCRSGQEKGDARWASIDEFDLPAAPAASKANDLVYILSSDNVSITYVPPIDEIAAQIVEYLGYNKSYGAGWLTGLKLRLYGKWDTAVSTVVSEDDAAAGSTRYVSNSRLSAYHASVSVRLRGIGLIPGNYCETP
ncbi:hypothetical protein BASA50_007606 [Batrachochytrium salamandrivorans]|uniref:Uncharacterized protein n=1 Tax=Batrachochytrium salamandrivorans TaxID=1357716 RepID=A0ABQ8F711_9FUNG|nr:hypothetical protein BASA61_008554 [Batrachochytrium salamandrivorans]KAH6593085.1 hypothetical protein BASA50_007606 [Batrachochytrium salamandrivorans]KAH9266487.1 hypothetical protein BASA84_001124 [Batrachochytrium salamandrivorans]